MKEQIILNITQEMLPYLDNAQLLASKGIGA